MTDEPKEPKVVTRPTVQVKPHSYQPSKAELEDPVKIDAKPAALAAALLRPVEVVEDPEA